MLFWFLLMGRHTGMGRPQRVWALKNCTPPVLGVRTANEDTAKPVQGVASAGEMDTKATSGHDERIRQKNADINRYM